MPQTSHANRRRAERQKASKGIALLVDSGHEQISSQAFAIDLSCLGARVRTQINLQPGQHVTVIPREGKTYAVSSRVIWVQDLPSDEAEAGLAFLEPLNPASPFFVSSTLKSPTPFGRSL